MLAEWIESIRRSKRLVGTDGKNTLMEMVVAWVVVAVAGLATLAGIFMLTRAIPIPWLRSLLRCLSAVWLMLPWRIEAVDGYYAPAYIVAIFEGIFRSDG